MANDFESQLEALVPREEEDFESALESLVPTAKVEDTDFAKQLNTDDVGDEEVLSIRERAQEQVEKERKKAEIRRRGLGQGLREFGQGALSLGAGFKDIIDPKLGPGAVPRRGEVIKKAKAQRKQFEESIKDLSPDEMDILKRSRSVGGFAPALAVPVGAGGLLARSAISGGVGAVLGEAAAPGEGAKTGGAFGLLAPAALQKVIVPAVKFPFKLGPAMAKLFGRKKTISKDIAKQLTQVPGQAKVQKRIKSAELAGQRITPGEAGGTAASNLREAQQKIGITDKAKQTMDEFYFDRGLRTERSIRGLQNKVHAGQTEDLIADDFKAFTAQLIKNAQKEVNAQARPFYEKAYNTNLPAAVREKLTRDPMLQSLLAKASKDPLFIRETSKYSENSLAKWDVLKKTLDDKIESASSALQPKPNLVRQLVSVKEFLVKELDAVSPAYKKARQVFGENVSDISLLRNSPLGKLNRLQGKSVLNKIFDQNEPNTQLLRTVRDMTLKEKPELWYGVARKRLEQEVGKVSKTIQQNPDEGIEFFNKILGNSNQRKVWFTVLDKAPESKKTMVHMMRTFDSMIRRNKAAASPELLGGLGGAEQGASISFNKQAALFLQRLFGGKYDAAVADVITSNRWIKDYNRISKLQPTSRKAQKQLIDLFSRYEASEYPELREDNQ